MAEEIKSAETTLTPNTEAIASQSPKTEATQSEDLKTYESEVKEQKKGVNEGADIDKTNKDKTNEVEFTDSSDKEKKETDSKKEEKEKQTKEQNSEFAKRRREEERKAELDKTRVETIIEVLNGKNPYTNEEMTDKEDVEDYLAMKEIEKQGGDPLKDYFKYRKKQRESAESSKTAEEQRKEWFANDKKDFVAKHPEVNLNNLIENKQFAKFAKGKVGNLPMTEIYEDFQDFVGQSEQKVTDKAAQMLANSQATPGSLKTQNATEQEGLFTREQVEKMSQKQVDANYDKIRESMKHW